MLEYELSVIIKVENKSAIENLFITVESLNTKEDDSNAIELLSISGLSIANETRAALTKKYEQDAWLSPLHVKQR